MEVTMKYLGHYCTVGVDGISIFYCEAGPLDLISIADLKRPSKENAMPFTMNVNGKTYASSLRLSASRKSISRRDALTLAGAGLAAPLLPAVSFAETRKETNPISYIKVGQENSQPIEIYYEDHGSGS